MMTGRRIINPLIHFEAQSKVRTKNLWFAHALWLSATESRVRNNCFCTAEYSATEDLSILFRYQMGTMTYVIRQNCRIGDRHFRRYLVYYWVSLGRLSLVVVTGVFIYALRTQISIERLHCL